MAGCWFGGFLALGLLIPLIDKLPMLPKLLASGIAHKLIFGVLAIILYRLWSSHRPAALLLRTVLLLLFTAILIPAAGFYFQWLTTVPERPLAFLATAAGLLNLLFYFQMGSTTKQPPSPWSGGRMIRIGRP